MISVAIKIGNIGDLRKAELQLNDREVFDDYDQVVLNSHREFFNCFTPNDIDRIYFGPEFCQNMIPNIQDINLAVEYAKRRGFKVTLVTPTVTDIGIAKISELFERADEIYYVDEVVFNDWGVFRMLSEKYPDIHYICGRLLDKTQRDPRINKGSYTDFFTGEGLLYLQSPSLTARSYQEVLTNNKISRVEIDTYPQGIALNKESLQNINLSLWYPFGYVTTGRSCIINMMDKNESQKFSLEPGCQRKCRDYTRLLYKREGSYSSELSSGAYDVNIFGKGNTVFYICKDLDGILKGNKDIINRLVFQPYLSV